MAQNLDISLLAVEMILQALRPVVHECFDIEESGASLEEFDVDDGDATGDAMECQCVLSMLSRRSWFFVHVLVGRTNLLEEVFDDFPENHGGGLMLKRDTPSVLLIAA